jgi:hypothetical protein
MLSAPRLPLSLAAALDLDASLAEQIDTGLVCHLTPIEATYGILSRGSIGAYVATLKYVPGVVPTVATLMHAAEKKGTGRGQPVDYQSFYERSSTLCTTLTASTSSSMLRLL